MWAEGEGNLTWAGCRESAPLLCWAHALGLGRACVCEEAWCVLGSEGRNTKSVIAELAEGQFSSSVVRDF